MEESGKMILKLDLVEKSDYPYKNKFILPKNMFDALTSLHQGDDSEFFKYKKKTLVSKFIEPIVGVNASPRLFRKLRFSSFLESLILIRPSQSVR